MNSRERYSRAITFAGPDRVPVMHRSLPGAFRKYGQRLEDLYARYPGDVLLFPSTRGWFAFRRGVGESSGKLCGAKDEWGCVWDSLTDDYLGQLIGPPLDEWEKLEGFRWPEPTVGMERVEEVRRRFGGRVCFRADMDRQVTLPFGTPAAVEAYVQRLYEAFGRHNGGYIGYGQVGTDAPLDNAEAMLAAFFGLRYTV